MSSWSGKGGVVNVTKITVLSAVVYAYDLKHYQVVGGPDWIRNDRFTISARAGRSVPDAQIKLMLQSLLEDRFKLVTHAEQRDMPFRALVVARADGRLGPTCGTWAKPARVKRSPRSANSSPRGTLIPMQRVE